MFRAEIHTGFFPSKCSNDTINHSIIGHLPGPWYFPRHIHSNHFSLLTLLNRLTMEDKVKCNFLSRAGKKGGKKSVILVYYTRVWGLKLIFWYSWKLEATEEVALKKHILCALCQIIGIECYLNVNERPFYRGTYYLSKWQHSESIWSLFSLNIGSLRHKQAMTACRLDLYDI